MDNITRYISEETDILYQRGEEKGKAEGKVEGKAEVVQNLLLQTTFPLSKIASIAGVSEAFVLAIKERLP